MTPQKTTKSLLEETLGAPFDRDRFHEFTRSLLGPDANAPSRTTDVPPRNADSLESLPGTRDPDGNRLHVLVVRWEEPAGTGPPLPERSLVEDFLRSSGEDREGTALVASVRSGTDDWRLSLLTRDPDGPQPENEEGPVPEVRPAVDCLSFPVGPDRSLRTVRNRLTEFLGEPGTPTVDELRGAFRSGPAADEFFEEYSKLHLKVSADVRHHLETDESTRNEFEGKGIRPENFSKTLLEQLLFLRFLEEDPAEESNRDVLRGLYEGHFGDYENFHGDVLEPLLYGDAGEVFEGGDFPGGWSRFLDGAPLEPSNDYEPEATNLSLDDALLGEVLDTFDRYNFTLREDQPGEEEVAVDPGMLGRVHERLHTGEDRKSKGAFYTPRKIVRFMCRESLVHYLSTELEGTVPTEDLEFLVNNSGRLLQRTGLFDSSNSPSETSPIPESIHDNQAALEDLLADVKICDPAVGSGAFPVGMMREIVPLRRLLDGESGNPETVAERRRRTIRSNLHGVDLDPGSVEVTRLRLWLSLVACVDRDGELPRPRNLDYGILQGDALVEENQEEPKTLKASGRKPFFPWTLSFHDVFEEGGFDLVIGNPPYGAEIPKKKEKAIRERLTDTDNRNSASYFMDFAKNRWTKQDGVVSLIVPKSLLYSESWFSLVQAYLPTTIRLVDVETAFEDVLLEQAVVVSDQSKPSNTYDSYKYREGEFDFCRTISNDYVEDTRTWVCEVDDVEFDILSKVEDVTYMREISETKRGLGLQSDIEDEERTASREIIGGRYIERYNVKGVRGYVTEEHFENSRKKDFLFSEKIVTQDILAHVQNPIPHVKITSAYEPTGELLTLDTVQNTLVHSEDFLDKYVLAVLNSRFASWYTYRFIYASAIRTMHFDSYYIGKLPVPNLDREDQERIVETVEELESLAELGGEEPEYRKRTRRIDARIYDYFEFTERERKFLNLTE